MDPSSIFSTLYAVAVLLPLISFFVILIGGAKWLGKAGEQAAYVAVAAIVGSAVCSFLALAFWLHYHWPASDHGAGHGGHGAEVASEGGPAPADHAPTDHTADTAHVANATEKPVDEHGEHVTEPAVYSGEYSVPGLGTPWVLGQFGKLRVSISYYVDTLTVCMFCMVTFIATLIHIYAMGYMHDELHEVTDHEVTTSSGGPLHRPGRFHRFFQYLSLFCFSMLGLVIAGNIAMVFVFWELVGVCSYFLIGFYVERKSASTAANKAFITNRVGDFGMIIGLMALWTGLGTFSFGDLRDKEGHVVQQGLFSLVRTEANHRQLATPDGLVALSAQEELAAVVKELGPDATEEQVEEAKAKKIAELRAPPGKAGPGYWLLIVAGIGIFTGCVGKSAQFPLHVWLPDAMEGPTPVSALVHSATMVAAGVYLVGRFYPVFTPEALLVIAVVGCITLFMAATIAITATDIKRVLAYSTVSQLGYMMLALGVGGWLAGLMHLITHAFFKSLLFMCSGSVIHAVHTNDMREMGGLRKKMPVTAYTMLVGCLAIAGAGLPFMMGWIGGSPLSGLGFSGFYSKDSILEQAYSFWQRNPSAWSGVFFVAAGGGAAVTAFYMFRMWYLTFAGQPRNEARYHHAHESPVTMYVPLIILAVMAVAVAWTPYQAFVGGLLAVIGFGVVRLMRGGAESHGHESHGHESHGHESHGHESHGHESHGHGGHGEPHGHDGPGQHGRGIPLADIPLVLSGIVFGVALLGWLAYRTAGVPFFTDVSLSNLLESARPAGTLATSEAALMEGWVWPNEHDSHAPAIAIPVTLAAIGTALSGFLLATFMYGLRRLNADEVRRQFPAVYRLLVNKWWFDELYDWMFIRPTLGISRMISGFDRNWIDRLVDGLASVTKAFSFAWERIADQSIVDGLVNRIAEWSYAIGVSFRRVQTGQIRQYVMFIVVGAVAIFVLISLWNSTLAG